MTTSGAPIAIRRPPLPASSRSCRAGDSAMTLVLVALGLAGPFGLRSALVVALFLVGVVVVDLVVLAAVGLLGLRNRLIALLVHGLSLPSVPWPPIALPHHDERAAVGHEDRAAHHHSLRARMNGAQPRQEPAQRAELRPRERLADAPPRASAEREVRDVLGGPARAQRVRVREGARVAVQQRRRQRDRRPGR